MFLDFSIHCPNPVKNSIIWSGGVIMKIVNLCKDSCCCPVVKLADDHVEIGEEGNLCTLTMSEWETLKEKILNNEL